MRTSVNDVVVPGTSRHRREWAFPEPKTQEQIADLCEPKVSKAWVSQFDNAKFKLDRAGAMRAAPAFFPEDWKRSQSEAIRRTWAMWFENVAAYGDDKIRRYAERMREIVLADIPSLKHTPILDPNQNGAITDNLLDNEEFVIGSGDVRELPQQIAERDRRKAREA